MREGRKKEEVEEEQEMKGLQRILHARTMCRHHSKCSNGRTLNKAGTE